jgi:hypothetical protein
MSQCNENNAEKNLSQELLSPLKQVEGAPRASLSANPQDSYISLEAAAASEDSETIGTNKPPPNTKET